MLSVLVGIVVFCCLFYWMIGTQFFRRWPECSDRRDAALLLCIAVSAIVGWEYSCFHTTDLIALLAVYLKFVGRWS